MKQISISNETQKQLRQKRLLIFSIILITLASITLFILLVTGNDSNASKNSKNFLPNARYLNVHLIAHSHDDLGWLKTMDQYYKDSVSKIITGVIEELIKDPTKKFTFVEMGYFKKWWDEQSEEKKTKVKQMLADGQIQFSLGGHNANDEACTYYEDIVDQISWGHRFLLNEFNYVPTIAWMIDSFGHSNSMPHLFSEMGYDAFFSPRISRDEKNVRIQDYTLETIWTPSYASGYDMPLLFHISPIHYSYPQGFDLDVR